MDAKLRLCISQLLFHSAPLWRLLHMFQWVSILTFSFNYINVGSLTNYCCNPNLEFVLPKSHSLYLIFVLFYTLWAFVCTHASWPTQM